MEVIAMSGAGILTILKKLRIDTLSIDCYCVLNEFNFVPSRPGFCTITNTKGIVVPCVAIDLDGEDCEFYVLEELIDTFKQVIVA
jgi:hypothetical protein